MYLFLERMLRAAKLDAALYEEVEADRSATGQAVGVVILSSLAAGIGNTEQMGIGILILGSAAALAAWYLWALLTYLIGTRILPSPQTKADVGELLRTIGFSSAPGLIRILGVIPALRAVVFLVAGVWMLISMVIAVRQALDYQSTWRALGVCLIGWVIQALILAAVMALTGVQSTPAQ